MGIFYLRSVIPELPNLFRNHRIICCDSAAIAESAEIFPGIKAESGSIAQTTNSPAFVPRPVGLGRIFDDF